MKGYSQLRDGGTRIRRNPTYLFLTLVASASVTTVAFSVTYTYTAVEVPGAIETQPFAVNDFGAIVGRYRTDPNCGSFDLLKWSYCDHAFLIEA